MSGEKSLVEKRLAWIARAKAARPGVVDVCLEEREPGYWEQRGYSNSAEPWYEDRFSSDGRT